MSTFFPENFYAAKAQPDWVYKKTTELDVLSDLIGPPPAGISQNLHQAITLLPLHLWKSKAELQVQGGDLFRKVYPFVSVEKVTTQQLRTLVGIAAKDRDDEADNDASAAARDVQKAISTKNVNAQEFIDNMDKAFRNDIIGAFFSAQLQAQFSAAILFPKTTVTLVEVQKVGNVLYAQFLITLKDVKVGGHPYAEYYVRKELIVVSTPESAFVVGTLLPSPEPAPRDPSFAAVSKWLNDFRVVI